MVSGRVWNRVSLQHISDNYYNGLDLDVTLSKNNLFVNVNVNVIKLLKV